MEIGKRGGDLTGRSREILWFSGESPGKSYLGKIPIWLIFFQMGWNYQPVMESVLFFEYHHVPRVSHWRLILGVIMIQNIYEYLIGLALIQGQIYNPDILCFGNIFVDTWEIFEISGTE